ncbi:MAG TPA: hypothetical protein VN924_09955 [Bryobacteraceae bacterium]|nr:hypothetical protein [Bryobacteraceae bacterium]
MTQRRRGTIIKTPDGSPGLLAVDGRQETFTLHGTWKSAVAPSVNMAVEIEFDDAGLITGLVAVDPQQAAKEKLQQIGNMAQERGKEAAIIAREGVGALAGRMGKAALAATVVLWIAWFCMPGVILSFSVIGLERSRSITFWDALALDPYNNMNPGSHGFLSLVVLACIAAPFAAPFIRHRRARYLYAAPLACLVLAWFTVQRELDQAFALLQQQYGVAAGAAGFSISPGYGTWIIALASLAVAALLLKRPASENAGVIPAEDRYCTNCGRPVSAGAKYCTNCRAQRTSAAATIVVLSILATVLAPALCQAQGYTITTAAGNGSQTYSGDGGPAASAGLYNPSNVALDAAGNLYIADTGDCLIRKVSPAGIITTVAGVESDGASICGAYNGDGGPATSALLIGPQGVAVDASGNLYIADTGNDRIREVSTAGIISTIAGGGGALTDGVPATQAELIGPYGIAIDAAGNLYIADAGTNRIRKVPADGTITTVAGTLTTGFEPGYAGDGGPATSALLSSPSGLALDATGNIYIADTGNDAIRKVSAKGTITTVAGKQLVPGIGDGRYAGDGGPATSAELFGPAGVNVDAAGDLFIADTRNQRIREVLANGTITTVAGNGTPNYSGDGGPATAAELYMPNGVTVAASGGVYIADTGNGRIRLLTSETLLLPAVGAGGVVNSGSYTAQGVAPGSLVSIFGTNLAASTSSGNTIPLPTALSDVTSVTFNGIPAGLYFVSSGQINAQLPFTVPTGTVDIVVNRSSGASAPQSVNVVPASPGIFTTNAEGTGQAFAYDNSTGDLAAPAGAPIGIFHTDPISVSSGHALIIACTGLGSVTPPVDNYVAASDGILRNTSLQPTVTIGGVPAQFIYSVLSPQFVSEYQIGVVPAAATPTGDAVPLQITINGVTTSAQVTIAVAP